jgi:hypothetical protein
MFCVAVPAFTMPMIMFSGLLYKRDSVPPYLSWLENVSIVNYSFSALLLEQVGPCLIGISCAHAYAQILMFVRILWMPCTRRSVRHTHAYPPP